MCFVKCEIKRLCSSKDIILNLRIITEIKRTKMLYTSWYKHENYNFGVVLRINKSKVQLVEEKSQICF